MLRGFFPQPGAVPRRKGVNFWTVPPGPSLDSARHSLPGTGSRSDDWDSWWFSGCVRAKKNSRLPVAKSHPPRDGFEDFNEDHLLSFPPALWPEHGFQPEALDRWHTD